MLEVKGLKKTFGKTTAVDNVSFSVKDKGLYVILGESGSGKSTIFNILTGMIKADEGEVLFNGKKTNDGINVDGIFGVVFQDGNLLGGLTVDDNLYIVSSDREKNDNILKRLGIYSLKQRKADKLSGGEKQRVAIARALASDCRVLLADEPTGSLDGKNAENVMRILKELSQEKTVLLITHNVDFANRYADGIMRLKKGKVFSTQGAFNDLSDKINSIEKNTLHCESCAKEENIPEQRRITGRIATRFSFWKCYDKILKNLTSVFILSIIFVVVALSLSISILDVNEKYIKFLQGYDNAVIESGDDFTEFRELLKGKNTDGLDTVFLYSWNKGDSSYIVVDNSLDDGEIMLGSKVAEKYNSTLLSDVQSGDIIDFDGTSFIMAGTKENCNFSKAYDLNYAVYLNYITADRFLDSLPFNIYDDNLGVTVSIFKDNSLSDNKCVLGFNLYYLLGSKDNDYIEFEKTQVSFDLIRYNKLMYSPILDIAGVVASASELEFALYVSEQKYEELLDMTHYYIYSLNPSDKELVDYWIQNGFMPKGEYFENYIASKKISDTVYPICLASSIIFAVLTALYALAFVGHICKINGKELFVLKTLRVHNKDLIALIILQTIPVAIISLLIGSFVSYGVVNLVIENAQRFFEPQAFVGITLSLTISAISLIVACIVRVYRLNKKFSPNLIRD